MYFLSERPLSTLTGQLFALCYQQTLLVTLPKYSPISKPFFPDSLSNKPFLIWLLTMPPHLKYPSYTTLQFDVNQLFSDAVGWVAGRASGL